MWTKQEAIDLCIAIEQIAPAYGCHVALTGGTLYKPGDRKDCDILFYRIRQTPEIDVDGLFNALAEIGLERTANHIWCHKATFQGKNVDCFFPEENAGPTNSRELRSAASDGYVA